MTGLLERVQGSVRPEMSRVTDLCRVTGCTSMLHVPHGDYLFPEIVRTPPDAIALSFPRRVSIELWRGIGRAYLQHSAPHEVRRLNAPTAPGDLEALLERERRWGYAISHGELVPNVTAIGAPVLEDGTTVAVLAVIGLDPDIPTRYGDVLIGAAARLTRLLTTSAEA